MRSSILISCTALAAIAQAVTSVWNVQGYSYADGKTLEMLMAVQYLSTLVGGTGSG